MANEHKGPTRQLFFREGDRAPSKKGLRLVLHQVRSNPPRLLVAGFLLAIVTGTILLSTPWATRDGSTDLMIALFTATSATCVTGLVVVDTWDHWSIFGQLVIMLLIQVGGLGVMAFVTLFALLLGKRIQLRDRLTLQKVLGKTSMEGIVRIFRYILLFSFTMEALGAIILSLKWIPVMGAAQGVWFGVFHAISAFNNAGFDLFGGFQGLTGFTGDPVINMVISGMFIVGGLGFVVVYEIYHYRETRRLSLHSKIVLLVTAILILTGTLVILVSEYNHALRDLSLSGKLMASYFQAVTPRTAGFSTLDMDSLLLPTQLMIMFLMFVGGSPGSTAGGIKTSTLALLGIAIVSIIQNRRETHVLNRRIEAAEVSRALAIALLGMLLIFVVTFLISFAHPGDFLRALFEVVSAIGTVGLSLGLTPELDDWGRILITATMFLGRVGPLTIGYALAYQRKQPNIRYPEGRIMIG